MMDRSTFLTKMLDKGKITKEQFNAAVLKANRVAAVKETAKTDLTKKTKTELIAIIDELK